MNDTRTTIVVLVVGGIVGAIVGAIVAVNLAIYLGPEEGYESSLGDLYRRSPVLAVAVVTVLIAGPIVGAVIAHRLRSRRSG
jgi:uncharacterized membrane protein